MFRGWYLAFRIEKTANDFASINKSTHKELNWANLHAVCYFICVHWEKLIAIWTKRIRTNVPVTLRMVGEKKISFKEFQSIHTEIKVFQLKSEHNGTDCRNQKRNKLLYVTQWRNERNFCKFCKKKNEQTKLSLHQLSICGMNWN